jgi:hypothetical protein
LVGVCDVYLPIVDSQCFGLVSVKATIGSSDFIEFNLDVFEHVE